MATHDYVIANASGAAVRTDLNNALAAIVSNNSSSSEPGTTYAYQWWADTTNNVLKIRNSANNGWITLRELDGTMLIEDGSASTPGLAFADDLNTGMFSSAADKINFSTGGSERLEILSTGIDVTGEVQCDTLDVDGTSDLAGNVAVSSGNLSMHSGGRIFVGNGGNAVNPMFANVSDTNTGIAFPAADTMVLSTGGSEAIRINSNQQVLCGTTTTAGEELLVTQGQVSNANAGGILGIRRGQTAANMSNGNGLGNIFFTDSAGEKFAGIYAQVDGTPGTGDCPGRLVLATTSDGASSFTERLRVTSDGRFLVGTSSGDGKMHVLERDASSDFAFKIHNSNSNNSVATRGLFIKYDVSPNDTNNVIQFNVGNGTPFVVRNNGNVQNTNGSFTSFSDGRYKENIVDANSQWEDLKNIRIRNWNFRPDLGWATHTMIGPVAQELEQVCPGLVTDIPVVGEDGTETEEVQKSVNQSVLYMKAVKALQEAMARIETLEAKVAALEAS